MSSYSFSTVNNVLPLGVQRVYVPRASRPHLAWASPTSFSTPTHVLGEHCRLKSDGTAVRETSAEREELERDEAEKRRTDTTMTAITSLSSSNGASEVALCGLLTTDAAAGTQLTLYHDLAAPGVPVYSSAIPSQHRVVALWAPSTTSEEDPSAYLEGNVQLYVSDDLGNIFHHRWDAKDGAHEPTTKRHRGEELGKSGESEYVDTWTSLAPAHSHPPSTPSLAPSSSTSAMEGLFTVTRGAPGWAGLTTLNTDSSTGTPQLISVREFYHDMRVIDSEQCKVVRLYGTTHPPTGLLCLSAQVAPQCVLVTEGCLATLFDVRCPSAVLSLGEAYAAQAVWMAAKKGAEVEKLEQQQGENGEGSAARSRGKQASTEDSVTGAKAASETPQLPPLIPGRLTSTVGQVRDVCSTANPNEVACAVDRALCVYDLRKFNRLFTSSSVLKYVIACITPVAGGRGVVCAGIDSEVRLVPLYEKAGGTEGKALSLAARAVAQSQTKKKQRRDTPKKAEVNNCGSNSTIGTAASSSSPAFDADVMGPGGTFRTRLSTTVSCTSVWQGGWVATRNLNGAAAVGVSIDGEVFLAQ